MLAAAGCSLHHPTSSRSVAELSDVWRTRAERTGYAETGRYAEVIDFCRRLAEASPQARYTSFGTSGEGRELPLLILSADRAFTPEAARRSDQLVLLIQNCIHPGECAGKDASLELARDILITGTQAELLEHVTVLIMPIFSPDGHERFSPYSRINQNGPREMGWRVTATNLNLNRDYTKADAVEMQAWLRLWHAWQPDMLIDNHTTNGSDHRYNLFYTGTTGPGVAAPIADWVRHVLYPGVLAPLAAAGYETLPYSWPRNRKVISEGVNAATGFSPRYSTGYGAVCNRPALLVEVHALKPYRRRVRVTYELLVHTLRTLNRDPDALRDAIRQSDRQCAATRGGEQGGRVPLRTERTDESRRITYRAFAQKLHNSEITGAEVIEYTDQPQDIETDLYEQTRVSQSVAPPAAYLVPPQWTEIIERLALHGVRFFRLERAQTLEVESCRFEDVVFHATPYESRQIPRYTTIPTHEQREFVAGTVVVPLDQPRAKLAVHLLEPDAPDSFLAWGLLNAIFEQKEYAEAYVMEPIARRMLADDPDLRRAFEEKLAQNEEFAGNPGQRLNFFYRRSPYYDQLKDRYPVARLMDVSVLRSLAKE